MSFRQIDSSLSFKTEQNKAFSSMHAIGKKPFRATHKASGCSKEKQVFLPCALVLLAVETAENMAALNGDYSAWII